MLAQPRLSAPRAGVSSPSALAGVAAAPIFSSTQAPNATSVATGKPTYIAPPIPVPQPNATSVVTKQPVYGPNAPSAPIPNATSVVTKQPVYGPNAPAVPQPSAPQTFAEPIIAPSGAKVDPNTGGVLAPASAPAAPALPEAPASPLAIANTGNAAAAPNYSAAAGGAPGGASAPGGTPAVPSFEDEYLKSLRATKEEEDAQARLDELAGAAALADANIGNQPIALPFITGQQAAVERSRAARSVPIAAQLARLQAKRQISMEASKAALEREDKKAEKKAPVSVGAGSSLVDPTTGKPIYTAPSAMDTKAPQTIETEKGILAWDPTTQQWVSTGFTGTKVAEKSAAALASANAARDKTSIVNSKIDEAVPQVSNISAGAAGALSQNIPGTPAYNLARTIDTIKANLGFQELSAMRAQSPTGGALGNVTERELQFLQATVASLDIGQDPAVLRKNLEEVKKHFETWRDAVVQASQEASGGSTGGGGGSIYDF